VATMAFLNGRLVPVDDAVLPADDRAVLFGDGAYETVRAYDGKVFRYPEHLRRLRRTLEGLGIDLPLTDAAIIDGTHALVEANGLRDARIRMTVTGGRHGGEIRLRRTHPPNFVMFAGPLTPPADDIYRNGVDVAVSRYTVAHDSPVARLKTIIRLVHLMAKEEALGAGRFEALFADDRGCLLEGTASNVFLVVDGAVVTPGLDDALLAGVTRDVVVELAREAGLPVREEDVPVARLGEASEAFLTSTTIELLPVCRVEGKPVGSGLPGPVRLELHRRYREVVRRETGVPLPPPVGA